MRECGERAVSAAEINAGIAWVAGGSAACGAPWIFLCECGGADCEERVRLTPAAYGGLRDCGRPLLAPGHELMPWEHARRRAGRLREDGAGPRAQALHRLKRSQRLRG